MSFIRRYLSRVWALGNSGVRRIKGRDGMTVSSGSASQGRDSSYMSTTVEVPGKRQDMLLYYLVTCLCVVALCYRFPDSGVLLVGGYLAMLLWRRR